MTALEKASLRPLRRQFGRPILDNCFAPRDVDGDGDLEFETERSNLADITDHPLDGAIDWQVPSLRYSGEIAVTYRYAPTE